jgi:hypothetical protein
MHARGDMIMSNSDASTTATATDPTRPVVRDPANAARFARRRINVT